MRLCTVAALALIVVAPMSVSLARAASDCSTLITPADWGENSTADIDLKSGEKARYKGSDTFAIKATGQGPRASGTSVITVNATIK
jgi:hypothetical protein